MDHVNERLARLKHLLGIVEEEQDGLLSTALQAVEDQVLNYLGREELPPELERALLLMTASYWKGAALGGGAAAGPVASVKRGDVSTSFAVSRGGSRDLRARGRGRLLRLAGDPERLSKAEEIRSAERPGAGRQRNTETKKQVGRRPTAFFAEC